MNVLFNDYDGREAIFNQWISSPLLVDRHDEPAATENRSIIGGKDDIQQIAGNAETWQKVR